MLRRFISLLILITYLHQVLISAVVLAAGSPFNSEADITVKVKQQMNGWHVSVKPKSGKPLFSRQLFDDESTGFGSDEYSSDSDGFVQSQSDNNIKINDLRKNEPLSKLYNNSQDHIGWLLDLYKFQLPSFLIGLDGSVILNDQDNYANQIVRLKAPEIKLSNSNLKGVFQLDAPQVSFDAKTSFNHLEIKSSVIEVTKDSQVSANQIISHGNLINLGIITTFDLKLEDCLNIGSINSTDKLTIASLNLENKGTIKADQSLFITSGNITNLGLIKSLETSLLASQGFDNQKDIIGEKVEVVSVAGFNNSGNLSSSTSKIVVQNEFLNTGDIIAKDDVEIKVFQSLKQAGSIYSEKNLNIFSPQFLQSESGEITAHDLHLSLQNYELEGKIETDKFNLNQSSGVGVTKALLKAREVEFNLEKTAKLTNQGTIEVLGELIKTGEGSLDNQSSIIAKAIMAHNLNYNSGSLVGNHLSIKSSELTNAGHIQAKALMVKAKKLINQGDLLVREQVTLDLETLVNIKSGLIEFGNLTCNPITIINDGESFKKEGDTTAPINGQITICTVSDSSRIKKIENSGLLDLGVEGMHIRSLVNSGEVIAGQDTWHIGESNRHRGPILYLDELQNNGILRHAQKPKNEKKPFVTLEGVRSLHQDYAKFEHKDNDKIGKIFAFAKLQADFLKKADYTVKDSTLIKSAQNALLSLTFLSPYRIEEALKGYLGTRKLNPTLVLRVEIEKEIQNNINVNAQSNIKGVAKNEEVKLLKHAAVARPITKDELNILHEVLPTLGQYFYCQDFIDKTKGMKNQESWLDFFENAVNLTKSTSSELLLPYLSYLRRLLDIRSMNGEYLKKIKEEIKQKHGMQPLISLNDVREMNKKYTLFDHQANGKFMAFAAQETELLKRVDFTEIGEGINKHAKNTLLSLIFCRPHKLETYLKNYLNPVPKIGIIQKNDFQVNATQKAGVEPELKKSEVTKTEEIKWIRDEAKARPTTRQEFDLLSDTITTLGQYFYCQDLSNKVAGNSQKYESWRDFVENSISLVESTSSEVFRQYLSHVWQLLNLGVMGKEQTTFPDNSEASNFLDEKLKSSLLKGSDLDDWSYQNVSQSILDKLGKNKSRWNCSIPKNIWYGEKLKEIEEKIHQKHSFKTKNTLTIKGSKGVGEAVTEGQVVCHIDEKIQVDQALKNIQIYTPNLVIHHPNFINKQTLEFYSPITINTKKFTNNGILKAPSIEILTDEFSNGLSNEQMGEISATERALKIHSKNMVDNRWGRLWGQTGFNITTQGDLLIGEAKKTNKLFTRNTRFSHNWYGLNGAFVSADGKGEIVARNIIINYGEVYSSQNLRLTASDLLVESGNITSQGNLYFKGKKLELTRHARECTNTACVGNEGGFYGYCNYYGKYLTEVSEAVNLMVKGNLYLELSEMVSMLSHIYVDGYFYIGKNLTVPSKELPSFVNLTTRGQCYYYWGSGPNCSMPTSTHAAQSEHYNIIRVGKDFKISLPSSCILSEASITSNGKLGISCDNFAARLTGQRVEQKLNKTLKIDLLNVAKSMAGGFIKENPNGTIQTYQPVISNFDWNLQPLVQVGTSLEQINSPMSPTVFDFALQKALSEYVGSLSLDGREGRLLRDYLFANGIIGGKGHFNNFDELISSSKPLIAMLAKQMSNTIYHIPQLIVPPKWINPYQSHGDTRGKEVKILTNKSQIHESNRIYGENKVTLKAGGSITRKTAKYVETTCSNNSVTVTEKAKAQQQILSEGDIVIESGGDYSSIGALTKADNDINITSKKGNINSEALTLTSRTTTTEKSSGGILGGNKTTITSHSTTIFMPDEMRAGRNVNLTANQNITGSGLIVQADNEINFKGSGIYLDAAVGFNSFEISTNTKSFGGKKVSEISASSMPVFCRNHLEAKKIIFRGKQAVLNGTFFKAEELNDKTKGGAKVGATVRQATFSYSYEVKNPLSKSRQWMQGGQDVMAQSEFDVRNITRMPSLEDLDAVEKEKVENNHMVFTSVIWDKSKTKIIGRCEELVQKLNKWQKSGSYHSQLIPQKVIQVFAIAASIYSFGAGFMAANAATTTLGATMADAALSCIVTQVGTQVAQTGNVFEAIKSVASDHGMRQVAIAATTAGVMHELGSVIKLDPNSNPSIVDYARINAIKTVAQLPIEAAISRGDFKDIAKSSGINFVAKTLGGYAANRIGNSYLKDELGYTSHKFLHALSGGAMGWIIDQSCKGAIAGAFGAVAAEMAGEAMQGSITEKLIEKDIQAKAEGKPLSAAQVKQFINEETERTIKAAQLSSTAMAAIVNLNPNIAYMTGKNAAENNLVQAIPAVVWFSFLSSSIYTSWVYLDVLDTYKREGETAALNKLVMEGSIYAIPGGLGWIVKGVTYKNAVQAWNAAKISIPGLSDAIKNGAINFSRGAKNATAKTGVAIKQAGKKVSDFWKRNTYDGVKEALPEIKRLQALEKAEELTGDVSHKVDEMINTLGGKDTSKILHSLAKRAADAEKTSGVLVRSKTSTVFNNKAHPLFKNANIKQTTVFKKPQTVDLAAEKVQYGFNYDISVFNKPTQWTAPVGTKQTYKVYERKDINWNMVRTDGDKKCIGMTNREAAQKYGKPPILPDGYSATVHHIGQDSRGALIETTTRLHDFKSVPLPNGKRPFDIIHSQYGYKTKNPNFPVNHDIWKKEVEAYWKSRGQYE